LTICFDAARGGDRGEKKEKKGRVEGGGLGVVRGWEWREGDRVGREAWRG